MDPQHRKEIGRTGLKVTQLGFGGGTLGDPNEITTDAQAMATLDAAYDAGIRYFDTAPWYGNTKSEHRLGQFLRTKPRDSFAISTKVGRVYTRPADVADFQANSPWAKRWLGGLPFDLRFDYSYEGILRSYEDSLNRLGLPRVDCLAIHDLDPRHRLSMDGMMAGLKQLTHDGGYRALDELRSSGEIRAIGAGINMVDLIPLFLERFEMDYFLVASPYTLLHQPVLDRDLALCVESDVSVVLGGVFASGILATGPKEGALYRYEPADAEIRGRVGKIADLCAGHGVPLAAAALQFPLHHPAVATVIPGANHPDQVTENLNNFQADIPAALWRDLKSKGYLRADAPTP